jgi:zinc protease
MQKATPLILVLFLAITAIFLSVRSEGPPLDGQVTAAETATPEATGGSPDASEAPPQNDATAALDPRPWPQETSDIPVDSDAVFGSLDNGFRYLIYPNSEPPGRVSFRLHIDAGSLMENEDQRGLAHFLEHMVFNGSKNFTAAELIPRMQRLGIAFGAHANAYTSFDETVYMLDLPDLSEETMKLGFTVMRDFGDGALLDLEEIDRERGVILSEKRSRDSVSMRLMEKQFEELLPGSLIAQRFPIGTEEVIENAPRERFLDFYTRYYTPARMTFIIVGDVDPAVMQARIEATFASLKNPADPGSPPELGEIVQPEGIQPAIFADPEVASTDVSLILIRPDPQHPDTVAQRGERLTLGIGHSILSRRFERISRLEGAAITTGSASNYSLFNHLELGSIDITAADDNWQDAVPVLEQEFRRALDHGFTQAELDEAKSNMLNAYEQQVKQQSTRKSEGIATVLVGSINDEKVFSEPTTDLRIAAEILAEMDLTEAHQAFRKFWDAPGYHLVLTTKESPENAKLDLVALFQESRGKPIEAPAARELETFGYTDFGKPGTVTSREEVEDLGITQLVFSNQIRVNLKPTDFEKGRIRILARIGSGKLTQPKDMPMLDTFATAVFEGGGLGKHSNDELQQILAGKNVSSSLAIGEDAFTLGGSTTPADFATQLQVMCASITDPGYRPEALWQFQKAIPMIYQQLKHTTAGPQQEMQAWLHGDDSRFAVAPIEKLSAYTIDDAKKWLTPELTKGYLELSLVGDFEIDEILPDILATFGALPARASAAPALKEARQIQFSNAPANKAFTFESKVPQGIATVIWKTFGVRGNQEEFRRLNIVGQIFGDRLREEVREKLGASYSPNAGAAGSDALEDVGYLMGQSVGRPEDVELLQNTTRDLADAFATKGATEDELDRAIKPLLGQLDRSLRDNTYWLGTVMSQSQEDPKRLDLARGRDADYRSITLAEVNALAKKYLTAENALLVSIRPVEE